MEGNTAVKEIFDNISDEELLIAVLDIKRTGGGSAVTKYGDMIGNLCGQGMPHDYTTARILILEQAAFRWAKSKIAVARIKEEDEA